MGSSQKQDDTACACAGNFPRVLDIVMGSVIEGTNDLGIEKLARYLRGVAALSGMPSLPTVPLSWAKLDDDVDLLSYAAQQRPSNPDPKSLAKLKGVPKWMAPTMLKTPRSVRMFHFPIYTNQSF